MYAQCLSPKPPLQVYTVNDLPHNLALIRRLRAKKNKENQHSKHVAERAGSAPLSDTEAARKKRKRKEITFTRVWRSPTLRYASMCTHLH